MIPAAAKRGMKTICWFEDVFGRTSRTLRKPQEKDLHGRNAKTLCFQ